MAQPKPTRSSAPVRNRSRIRSSPTSSVANQHHVEHNCNINGVHADSNGSAGDSSDWFEERRRSHLSEGYVVPRHVAFIPDGNGRWGVKRNLGRIAGHVEGAKRVKDVVECCRRLGVEFVTIYGFSTENWNRPEAEVRSLMHILEDTMIRQRAAMRQNGVKLVAIGQGDRLSKELQDLIKETSGDFPKGASKSHSLNGAGMENPPMTLCLAVSYGGRDEIARAAQAAALAVSRGELKPEEITESVLEGYLSTKVAGISDPDLVIRTAGENRMSNFLLWQTAYSEVYISPKEWPDFREADLMHAFTEFGKRERKYGRVVEPKTPNGHHLEGAG